MAGTAALQKLHVALSLYDRLSGPLRKVRKGIGDFAERTERATQSLAFGFITLRGAMAGLSRTIAPFAEHSRALAELSTLDLGRDALEAIDRTARRVSGRFGQDATAIVRSAYDIQSAIAGLRPDELARFTEVGAVLAKGTLARPEVITDFLGTMFGIFEKDAARMGKAAWAETLAGMTAISVQMFKTTGAKMATYFTGLGAEAQAAGLSMAEQFAVGGRLMATMGGGEAATKFRAFLVQAGTAQKKLGLSFTDAAGRMLPVAAVLDKLKDKFGQTIDVAEGLRLKQAFGSDEAVAFVKLLIGNTGTLRDNLAALEKAKGLEPAMRMAEKATTPFDRLAASARNLWLTLGRAIEPALTPALDKLNRVMARVQVYAERFPHLARLAGTAAVGFFALAGVVGAAGITLGLFRFALAGLGPPIAATTRVLGLLRRALSLKTASVLAGRTAWLLYRYGLVSLFTPLRTLKNLSAALKLHVLAAAAAVVIKAVALAVWRRAIVLWRSTLLAATAAMWLFNASLWANPVTWVVAGVLALIAAVVVAVIWWDELKAAAGRAWDWIGRMGDAALETIRSGWKGLKGWFGAFWEWLAAGFAGAVDGVASLFGGLPGRVADAWEALRTLSAGLWMRLTGGFGRAAEAIAGYFAGIPKRMAGAWRAIRASAAMVWQGITGGFGRTIDGARNLFAGLPERIATAWEALYASAFAIWSELTRGAGAAIDAVAGVLLGLPERIETAWQAIGATAAGLRQSLRAGFGRAVEWIGGLFAGLPERIAATGRSIGDGAADAWQAIAAGFGASVDRVAGLFAGLPGRIGAAWQAISGAASGLWRSLTTGSGQAIDAVAGLFAGLPERVTVAWQALQKGTAGFLTWLAAGFHAAIETVVGWFAGLPERIGQGISAAFERVIAVMGRLAGPETLLGKTLGVFGIKFAPQTERLQDSVSARPGQSLAQRATRVEPPPPEVRQAVTHLARNDNRRTVTITQHIRTEKFDPAAFERGLFALGLR